MKSSKTTIEEQIAKWEDTRKRGKMNYVIKRWVLIYGILLPLIMVLPVSIISFSRGISIKSWVFFAVFEPIFISVSFFCGLSSWKYWEKRYESWIDVERDDLATLPGTRVVFEKKVQLLLGIYCIPIFVFNILSFFGFIFFGSIFFPDIAVPGLFFVTFGSVFIISALLIVNTMVFVKNPICGHGILSNPDPYHRHPDAKGNYWISALNILKGRSFICQDCAGEYYLEKSNNQVEIVKAEKYNHVNLADAKKTRG